MTTVFQRRTTMAEFQSMGIKPYDVYAYRDGKWVKIPTTDLLPGDLISITRTNEGSALPCDLLLVDGSAIVNEAMLSGESTPLLKESIKLRPADEQLQPEGFDKTQFYTVVPWLCKLLNLNHQLSLLLQIMVHLP